MAPPATIRRDLERLVGEGRLERVCCIAPVDFAGR